MIKKLLTRIAKNFFNGLLFMVPLVITIYVFYIVFIKIDGILPLKIPVPGAGFIITVLVISIVGFLASNIVTQKYFKYIDLLFAKLPVVKIMYSALKDFINAFVGSEKRFNKPAIITLFPEQGLRVFGFVTSEGIESMGVGSELTAVYIPQSYNFAGNLFLVPKERVELLDANSAKVMALIVSAGVAGSTNASSNSNSSKGF